MQQSAIWKVKYRISVLWSMLKKEILLRDALPILFLPTSKAATLVGKKEQKFLGEPFLIPPQSYGEYLGLLGEIVVTDQYHAKDFIKKDSIVIDAGANLGAFSRLASRLAPKGKIYAFEPTPETFKTLSANTRGCSNINCYLLGLGDIQSQKTLLILENWTGGNSMSDSLVASTLSPKEQITVQVTTIDRFVVEQKIFHVDFIKINYYCWYVYLSC